VGEALASSIHYASGDRRGGIVLGIARDYSSLRDKGMIFETSMAACADFSTGVVDDLRFLSKPYGRLVRH